MAGARRAHVRDRAAGARLAVTETTRASPMRRPPSSRLIAPADEAHLRALGTHPVRHLATLRRALKPSQAARGPRCGTSSTSPRRPPRRPTNYRDIGDVHAYIANVASDVAMLMATYGAADGRAGASPCTARGVRRRDRVRAGSEGALGGVCRVHQRLLPRSAHEAGRALVLVQAAGRPVRARRRGPRLAAKPPHGAVRRAAAGALRRPAGPRQGTTAAARSGGGAARARRRGGAHARRGRSRPRRAHPIGRASRDRRVSRVSRLPGPGRRGGAVPDRGCLLPAAASPRDSPSCSWRRWRTGSPVVTTRIAGVSELVDDGVNGVVVAAGRVDLLADALARPRGRSGHTGAMGSGGKRAGAPRVRHPHVPPNSSRACSARRPDLNRPGSSAPTFALAGRTPPE